MNKIILLEVGEKFPINEEMAGIVPMASDKEQIALTDDIAANGLREPVVLWRKEIVDGRCRQKACNIAQRPIMAIQLNGPSSRPPASSRTRSWPWPTPST